jgi:hypothetical protein
VEVGFSVFVVLVDGGFAFLLAGYKNGMGQLTQVRARNEEVGCAIGDRCGGLCLSSMSRRHRDELGRVNEPVHRPREGTSQGTHLLRFIGIFCLLIRLRDLGFRSLLCGSLHSCKHDTDAHPSVLLTFFGSGFTSSSSSSLSSDTRAFDLGCVFFLD